MKKEKLVKLLELIIEELDDVNETGGRSDENWDRIIDMKKLLKEVK